MQHAYSSFNKTIQAIIAELEPGTPVIFGHPTGEDGQALTLPPNCIRVYWLEEGQAGRSPDEEMAMIQIDIFKPDGRVADARALASKLNDKMGFRDGAGYGVMGRFDHTQATPVYLSEMRVRPWEAGWMTIPDRSPRQVHLARTFYLVYKV